MGDTIEGNIPKKNGLLAKIIIRGKDGYYYDGYCMRKNDGRLCICGKGIERLPNGNVYKGDYENGYYHGKGEITYSPSGIVYSGEFSNGYYHGKGIMTWPITESDEIRHPTYTGMWVNSKEHGYGVYDWGTAGGERYEGEWANGDYHGKGTLYTDNGDMLVGYWQNGKKTNTFTGK